MQIRTTKFPLFFWGFNRSYECSLDFEQNIYKNLEANTEYKFKKLNNFLFLILKYLPIFFVFLFTFNRFDFFLTKLTMVAYIFAIILASAINLFENMLRQFLSIVIIVVSAVTGFFIGEIFLVAYTLKYFLLLSVLIMVFLDMRLDSYSIVDDKGKILSNFIIPKRTK